MPQPGESDWRRHYVLGLSVCPSLQFVTYFSKLMNMTCWKRMNWLWCRLVQVVHIVRAENDQL